MGLPRVSVRVPASTANLGPGFDTLGMALDVYAWIEMAAAERTSISLYGDELKGIPADKSNLVYQVAQQVFNRAGVVIPELEIKMYSDIPLTRGMGSSASAIVGALVAANALAGDVLSKAQLFDLAAAREKHPDNVGASLYGGIAVTGWDGKHASNIRVEPHERLEVLVAIPQFQLSTEKVRQMLPQQLSLADAVFNVSKTALLVAALATHDFDAIGNAMQDKLHQPHRAALIPGMTRILQHAVEHGALGAALSGAGPTLLALVDRESSRKAELEAFLLQTLQEAGIPAITMWLNPDLAGTEMTAVGEVERRAQASAEAREAKRNKGEIQQ